MTRYPISVNKLQDCNHIFLSGALVFIPLGFKLLSSNMPFSSRVCRGGDVNVRVGPYGTEPEVNFKGIHHLKLITVNGNK